MDGYMTHIVKIVSTIIYWRKY